MVFGAIFTANANDDYRTITPEMLKEQMPQQTQLFQPNIEDPPPNNYNYNQYNQYSNTAPPESHAPPTQQYSNTAPPTQQNENHYQMPSPAPAPAPLPPAYPPQTNNYGYWVHHGSPRGAEPRDAGHSMAAVYMPMPMYHEYDPEHIGMYFRLASAPK